METAGSRGATSALRMALQSRFPTAARRGLVNVVRTLAHRVPPSRPCNALSLMPRMHGDRYFTIVKTIRFALDCSPAAFVAVSTSV